MQKENNRAKEQALAQFNSIKELLTNLKEAKGEKAQEEARTALDENALSAEKPKTTVYEILLCWGGPAVRIIGELNDDNEPFTARLQYQDWGTYWTDYACDSDILLQYVSYHYFGE